MLTASTEAGIQILYSTDNQNWNEYTTALEITENGTWYFKASDAAGNTGYAQRTFDNIDNVAPAITLTGDNETPLQSSMLTASTEAGLALMYSTDNQKWNEYTTALEITANGTWYFKATDAAGNVGTAQITFGNIDNIAPVIELVGDNSTPLQQSTLTASTEEDVTIYYSTDNQNWNEYTTALEITANGTWYFKATDNAGNIGTAQKTFENIYNVAPIITLTGDNQSPMKSTTLTASTDNNIKIFYSMDNKFWAEYDGEIEITANGTWYFKATDAAGNTGTAQITFDNIDTTAPTITLTGDNETPLQATTLTASTEVGLDIYWSTDNQSWTKYTSAIDVTANATYHFKATDAAGNESTAQITFENIDTTAPTITLTADNETPLQSTTLAATTENGLDIYWSTDKQSWTKYTDALDITSNGTWHFKATDAAGNEGTAQITFDNIDTTAPSITLTGDNETPLQSSTLTASTEVGLDIYWSTDNLSWTKYTNEIDVTANATYHFKATDAAGNEGTAQITFDNIDTVAPTITLTGNNQTPLQSTTLTASTDDGSQILYSTDNENWCEFTGSLMITDNGTWHFKATDAAGNVGTASITFENIDNIAPSAPVASADVTGPTNGHVTITAEFSDDSVVRQYRIGDGEWQDYVSGITLNHNGTVWFRSQDSAGNMSDEVSYNVTNIDTTLPDTPIVTADNTDITWRPVSLEAVFPEDAILTEWRLDGGAWNAYTGPIVISENALVEFRGTDEAGNASLTPYDVTNIVTPQEFVHRDFAGDIGFGKNYQDTFDMDVALPGYFTLSGTFGTLNGTIEIMNGKKKVASGTVKKGELTFNNKKTALLAAGDYTVVVKNTDKGKSASQYSFSLNGQTVFTKGDNSDDWSDLKTKGANGMVGSVGTLSAETASVACDWAGFGDAIDYKAFTLDSAASLEFDVSSTDAVKFTVWSLQSKEGTAGTTYSLKSLGNITPKANKTKTEYTASTKSLLLGKGTYYLSVESTNAAKGGNADYAVSLGKKSAFFTKGDNSDDTWNSSNPPAFMGEWNDWTGFGDAIDYRSLTLGNASRVSFDITSTDAAKFTVWQLDAKTGKLKSIQATTLKADKAKTQFTANTNALLLNSGTYFLSMESTNAKNGGNAEYSVTFGNSYEQFSKGNNTDDAWNADNLPAFMGEWTDWTGFGDAIDYRAMTLDYASRVSFDLTATDATKFTVWQLDAKSNKLKSVQATTLAANKEKTQYTASSKELLLGAGTYYISMECTAAKKGGSADFTVAYANSYGQFTKADNSNDTWKAAAKNDAWAIDDIVSGWVGFGDANDFYAFQVDEAGKLSLTFDEDTEAALKAKQIKLSCLDAKGKAVSLAAFKNGSVDSSKALAAGTYYLGVTCANVQKYDTNYSVNLGMLA